MLNKYRLLIGLTGASGIKYGLRLIEQCSLLKKKYSGIDIVYTEGAVRVARYEEDIDLENYLGRIDCIDTIYGENDWGSPLASSSSLTGYDAVVVPTSLNTLAKLANSIQDNLLLRSVSSIIRIGGKTILVVRETPLSTIDLWNMYKLSLEGVVIMPASPGFYIKPRDVDDLVYFIVGKILDQLGIEHELYPRWQRTSG